MCPKPRRSRPAVQGEPLPSRNRRDRCHVHLHSLVLDGVFTRSAPTAAPVFQELPAPTDEEVARGLERVHRRVRRLLGRRGRLPEEESSPSDPVAEQMPLLAEYASASIQGSWPAVRGRVIPCAGSARRPQWWTERKPRCARLEGFSLHANVGVPAHARGRLEHLGRYLWRPPLALERLTESSRGQLVFALPHPRTAGATHLRLHPLVVGPRW
ncbi:MAG: transposase [Candidatus Rokuibacteriota bacterium]